MSLNRNGFLYRSLSNFILFKVSYLDYNCNDWTTRFYNNCINLCTNILCTVHIYVCFARMINIALLLCFLIHILSKIWPVFWLVYSGGVNRIPLFYEWIFADAFLNSAMHSLIESTYCFFSLKGQCQEIFQQQFFSHYSIPAGLIIHEQKGVWIFWEFAEIFAVVCPE